MTGFVVGLVCGAALMFCISCLTDFPFYRAARKHLTTSKKMLDEQQKVFSSFTATMPYRASNDLRRNISFE
jgi:hypothetical protein